MRVSRKTSAPQPCRPRSLQRSPRNFSLSIPVVVSEAIPAFYIGRNEEGFWVARDVKGRTGGIFLFEDSAVSFARRNSRPTGCATIFSSERLELDLKNGGNPLIGKAFCDPPSATNDRLHRHNDEGDPMPAERFSCSLTRSPNANQQGTRGLLQRPE